MSKYSHLDLVQISEKWIKKQGFQVVASELKTTIREIPDVFGFRSNSSMMIECKCSRSDFLRDFKKPERNGTSLGVGNYRLYISEEGLLQPTDMPLGWGLLEVNAKGKVNIVHFKQGNIWYGNDAFTHHQMKLSDKEKEFLHMSNIDNERRILYSMLRRL